MAALFLDIVTALGVLCCFALFVCLTLLASFFLPLPLYNVYMYTVTCLHPGSVEYVEPCVGRNAGCVVSHGGAALY